MNLFLGNSDETSDFYAQILYPRASDYFGISVEDLESLECNPIALYNFFIEKTKIVKEINTSRLTTPHRTNTFMLDSSILSETTPISDD